MHPSLTRLLDSMAHRESERTGAMAMDAEERVRVALARIGATALYLQIQRNAHMQEQSYAEAMNLVADCLIREGLPPSWSVE